MPVISLLNGKSEVVFDERDLEYLILTYVGFDARDFFNELIEEYETAIEDLRDEIDDLKKEVKERHK